jgi:hypothetical protein
MPHCALHLEPPLPPCRLPGENKKPEAKQQPTMKKSCARFSPNSCMRRQVTKQQAGGHFVSNASTQTAAAVLLVCLTISCNLCYSHCHCLSSPSATTLKNCAHTAVKYYCRGRSVNHTSTAHQAKASQLPARQTSDRQQQHRSNTSQNSRLQAKSIPGGTLSDKHKAAGHVASACCWLCSRGLSWQAMPLGVSKRVYV